MDILRERLLLLADENYKNFSSKLVPTVDKDKVIGVKTPVIRKFARELVKEDAETAKEFLHRLPHEYLEENTLHGMLISILSSSPEECIKMLNDFLPYVDNWSTCDTISPKIFKKDLPFVHRQMKKWLETDDDGKPVFENEPYRVRFAIVTLLGFFLNEAFEEEDLYILEKINSQEYYINMAIAWYYSFAFIKQYDVTIKFFERKTLEKWIHNKSIQKALESYRISKERKDYLRALKIK